MAKDKVTITLDRVKAKQAQAFLGASTTSETIDLALDRLIREEQTKRDVEAYRRYPQTEEELAIARLGDYGDLDDDTDWEALYAEDGEHGQGAE
ncbi:MAG TPA: type II toxin-antitoxin system VapB family antitoxin [Chloroflexota bacterium]|nr:type II toxin-antitoxin system VapB family antitoxin [Chloroflexota bacterium]